MACSGCANSVESALKTLNGLSSVEVDLEKGQARVSYDDDVLSEEAFNKAIKEAGYEYTGMEN